MAIGSIFDKNVFNQESYSKMVNDSNGQYKIVITPTSLRQSGMVDVKVKGVLTEEVSFNFQAEYDTFGFGGLISNSKWLELAYKSLMMPLRYQGRNLDNAGIVTEKFYVKSGYLKINPTFKVVDWVGNNMPLKAALALISYCLPQREQSLTDVKQRLIDAAQQFAAEAKIPGVEEVVEIGGASINVVSDVISSTINSLTNPITNNANIGSTATKALGDAVDNGFILTSSPTPVSVSIGNWFYNGNMIIEDVNVKFSKEMTKSGPLSVDISLQMSSKEALSIGEDGFQFHTQKRVFTADNLNTTGTR